MKYLTQAWLCMCFEILFETIAYWIWAEEDSIEEHEECDFIHESVCNLIRLTVNLLKFWISSNIGIIHMFSDSVSKCNECITWLCDLVRKSWILNEIRSCIHWDYSNSFLYLLISIDTFLRFTLISHSSYFIWTTYLNQNEILNVTEFA